MNAKTLLSEWNCKQACLYLHFISDFWKPTITDYYPKLKVFLKQPSSSRVLHLVCRWHLSLNLFFLGMMCFRHIQQWGRSSCLVQLDQTGSFLGSNLTQTPSVNEIQPISNIALVLLLIWVFNACLFQLFHHHNFMIENKICSHIQHMDLSVIQKTPLCSHIVHLNSWLSQKPSLRAHGAKTRTRFPTRDLLFTCSQPW